MNKFLKTRARRLSCSATSFLAAFVMSCYLAYRKEADSNVLLSDAEMAARLLFFPCAVAVLYWLLQVWQRPDLYNQKIYHIQRRRLTLPSHLWRR